MNEIILVKIGELILKGNNRSRFEDRLMVNIKHALRQTGSYRIWKSQGTMYVEPRDDASPILPAIEKVKKVFGITQISHAYVAPKDINEIYKVIVEKLADSLNNGKTFKVEAKRADKRFPMTSPEICREAGGVILKNFSHLKVDVKNPEITVIVDVRDEFAYIYCDKTQGAGGIPTGMGGKGLLLLSGGIDSPVAGWLMAKRGVELEAINFFSYPYTSDRAKEKVIALSEILQDYTGKMPLHIAPFTEIQMEIKEKCPEEQLTIIMRRFMNRISQKVAEKVGAKVLITGESLGQVASQTMQSMVVTSEVATMPILRPLVGLDKVEIINYARRIGSYDTSILPYEDCCTLFVPKRPDVNPRLDRILESEAHLDIDGLVNQSVKGIELIG
ncbi:MAG: tRNA 4-thiouridine(8) synthase ThiI [Clostridia bacterium]|nr:tRNA 4-thiouridine(8) synthase ThiI [Clostridia bacterium]